MIYIFPNNNRAQHDTCTPCGSRVRTRMQQSCAHWFKGVRSISVRRICVAVCDHSCRHASWSNETHRKLRFIKFIYLYIFCKLKNFWCHKFWDIYKTVRDTQKRIHWYKVIVQLMFIQCVSNDCYCSSKFFKE